MKKTVSINDALKLKEEAFKSYGTVVHFHDSCGGQYFTCEDKLSADIKKFVTDYFKSIGMQAHFAENGIQFWAE